MTHGGQTNSGLPHPSPGGGSVERPRRRFAAMLLKIAAVLFVTEFAIMRVLPGLGVHGMWHSVVDSLMLTILALPGLYYLTVRSRLRINAGEAAQDGLRLFRYFVLLSVCAMTGILLMVGFGLRGVLREHILEEAQENAFHVATSLRAVELETLVQTSPDGRERLELDPQRFAEMDQRIRDFLAPFDVIKIKVFDPDMRIIYSTDPEIIGKTDADNPDLRRALSGETVSLLEDKDSVWDLVDEKRFDVDLVETYLPVFGAEGQVVGSFETYEDVTPHLCSANRTLARSMVILFVALVVVFSILTAMMHRAARAVRARTTALAFSEAKTRAVVDSAADAIITIDEQGTVESFNASAERIFGYEAGAVIGQPLTVLMPERLVGVHLAALQRYLETGTRKIVGRSVEVLGRREDGSEVPLALSVSEFRVGDRRMFAGIARDITERKQREEELETAKAQAEKARWELEQIHSKLLQSDKMASIGQLAAGVAHEINNPIGFISSNLNSLSQYVEDIKRVLVAHDELLRECQEGHSVPTAKAEDVRRVRDELDIDYVVSDLDNLIAESVEGTGRVRQIVADLRDFSHVDSPDIAEENINQLLDKTINVAWNELKYKAEVVREYGEIPDIPCYGGKLAQVFLNLIVNAAQAIEEKGTITIRTGLDHDHIWVEVEDTGGGIPPEALDRVFEAFFTTKEVGKGTGMGLHLACNIVEAHGGYIDYKSTVGQGTTFRIELPLSGPPAETAKTVEVNA